MGSGPGFSFSVGGPLGTLVPWTLRRPAANSFHMISSIIIVFSAREGLGDPEKAVSAKAESLIAREK